MILLQWRFECLITSQHNNKLNRSATDFRQRFAWQTFRNLRSNKHCPRIKMTSLGSLRQCCEWRQVILCKLYHVCKCHVFVIKYLNNIISYVQTPVAHVTIYLTLLWPHIFINSYIGIMSSEIILWEPIPPPNTTPPPPQWLTGNHRFTAYHVGVDTAGLLLHP